MEDEASIIEVFDGGDHIQLQINSGMGWSFTIYMDDNDAEEMIRIVQNKLNSRWKKDVQR